MAGHGRSNNRGLEAGSMPGLGYGRFGRMFPDDIGPVFPLEAVEALAAAMVGDDAGAPLDQAEPDDENPTITAGYTYFGQFIDHDITFDPTPLRHQLVDVDALEDFRTPALDLDSVYGSGPEDQPYLYKSNKLRLGANLSSAAAQVATKQDLPRLGDGTAILGDKRNDENKLVAQLHSAFVSLHNRLYDDEKILVALGGDLSNPVSRFRAAVSAARWHYQWVVVNDFLAQRICAPGVVQRVLNRPGSPLLANYTRPNYQFAYMPVEFSGAAYRLGHSMVRPSYALNSKVFTAAPKAGQPFGENRIPIFGKETPDRRQNMNGFGPVPEDWGIDWAFFLPDIPTKAASANMKIPQPAYRMDASLVLPLGDLPDLAGTLPNIARSLAFLNLSRGSMLRLPTAEQVIARLQESRVIPTEKIWSAGSRVAKSIPDPLKDAAEQRTKAFKDHRAAFEGKTPLWYYVLREGEYFGVDRDPNELKPELGGQHLGPVGSQIVAETFIGLLFEDAASYINAAPFFKPLIPHDTTKGFLLSDIVKYALGS
jgi:hypothetical protein